MIKRKNILIALVVWTVAIILCCWAVTCVDAQTVKPGQVWEWKSDSPFHDRLILRYYILDVKRGTDGEEYAYFLEMPFPKREWIYRGPSSNLTYMFSGDYYKFLRYANHADSLLFDLKKVRTK